MALSFFLSTNSNKSSIDTANSLNNINNNNAETAGSAVMFGNAENDDCAMDAFGGKDIFGTPDLSNMDSSLFANAGNTGETEAAGSLAFNAEAAGSLACADGGAGASVSVGCDSGSSGGGFSSFG